MGRLPVVPLGSLADSTNGSIAIGPFGSAMKADTYAPVGVPVIRGTNISETRSWKGDWVYISEDFADDMPRCVVGPDELVFPHRGAIGEVAIIPADHWRRYFLSSSLMKIRIDAKKADPLFVYYFFRSDVGRSEILRFGSQVGTPGIGQPLASLRQFKVPCPSLSEQRAIAHVLGLLDDKIDLNRRVNETLEALARAVFKDWFIDFGPTRAKMGGRQPYLAPEIWALFPDRLDGDGKPDGWNVLPFAATVDIIGGGTPKTAVPEYWNGDIPWFSVVDAPSASDVWALDTEKKITAAGVSNSSAQILPVGTTIISARGTVGRVALVGVPMAMNQSCYGLRSNSGGNGLFTYYSVRAVVIELQQHAHGSVFDTITRDTLAAISVVMPPVGVVGAFENYVAGFLGRIRAGLIESRTLAQIRDLLLPKLMSGEIRLTKAEKAAAELV
jgi:type I restriction enzyme, S subunit